ncbi:MAG: hypothetical protein R2747_14385 [Pyrinomonadaceae bacterium]
MDLVNELENDLALAFLVERKHSEKLDSQEVLALMNKVRDVLKPLTNDEQPKEQGVVAGQVGNVLAH